MHFTALDKAVGVVTATYVVAELGSQFAHANSTQRVILVLLAPVYLSFFLLPHFLLRDRWARFRAPFALSLKAAVLLCSVDGVRLVHMQTRLNNPPSSCLVQDIFQAVAGLRLAIAALTGVLQLPWALWVAQQATVLAGIANLDQDCSSPLLSHPLMAGRISAFHEAMSILARPVIPQAQLVIPDTEAGRCKAAVCFWSFLLALLLPATLLVPPKSFTAHETETEGLVSWLNRHIEGAFQAMRYWQGATETPFYWWLVLLVTWGAACLAFHSK